jgi:hypothetical protein
MAIISIPTSIGGVTIPVTATRGPLGALFDSKYKMANYQYPRDLGSATKGHAIKFTINEPKPISYQTNLTSTFTNLGENLRNTAQQGTAAAVTALGAAAFNTITDIASVTKEIASNANLSLTKREKRQVATVALYMPDTVNFQYTPQYNNLGLRNTLIEAGGKIFGKKVQNNVTAAITSDITRLALATQGLALNPLNQLLFDAIDFRTYQLAFTFTPYSQQEAEDVKQIIKLFKEAALPRITDAAFGMFFIPPSTLSIDFLYNGKTNTGISRVTESVIDSIDINYAPNGWSAHADGAPVQTTLTMNFKEIELVDKKKIAQGY